MRKSDQTNEPNKPDHIRNFCIISHVDHGKTTLSDHLLASGGMLPGSMAGKLRALDDLEIEQDRGITIEDSVVSFMLNGKSNHRIKVNLIDTPGHVDFSGKVSDAISLVDNAIIIVDAVEGVMAQTVTVIRQAIEEQLVLFLFINKIDRLIEELQLDNKGIRERLERIIGEVHSICKEYQYDLDLPQFSNNHVILGSALDGWAVDFQSIKLIKGMETIISWYNTNKVRFPPKFSISKIFSRLIVEFFLSPKRYQKRLGREIPCKRYPKDIVYQINSVSMETNTILRTGRRYRNSRNNSISSLSRILSGHVDIGDKLYSQKAEDWIEVEDITPFRGKRRVSNDNFIAGDILGIQFSQEIQIGDILTWKEISLDLKQTIYLHEPVISMVVEPENYDDYENLVKELDILSKIQSNFKFHQNEETGELMISGLGLLQLEIIVEELNDSGYNIYTSQPQLIEYLIAQNKSSISHEEYSIQLSNFIEDYELDDVIRIYADDRGNLVFTNKQESCLDLDAVEDAFKQFVTIGPNYRGRVRDFVIEVNAVGEKLSYEDSLVIMNKLLRSLSENLEFKLCTPMFVIHIRVDDKYVGNVVNTINQYKGKVKNISTEETKSKIEASIPILNVDLADSLRRETDGHIYWNIIDTIYQEK